MTGLHLYDARNHVYLRGLYIPRAWPDTTSMRAQAIVRGREAGTPDDDSVGTALMSLAKTRTAQVLGGTGHEQEDAGLQTWIFGPSRRPRAALDCWFHDARPAAQFRVAVHRTPRRYAGRTLRGMWDEADADFSALVPSATPRDEIPLATLHTGLAVLHQCLGAYARSTEAVVTWADTLGHPYTLVV